MILFLPLKGLSQHTSVSNKHKFANGYTIESNQSIKLGKPSTPKGFKYIKGLKENGNNLLQDDLFVIKHIVITERPYEDVDISLKGSINDDKCYIYFYPALESGEIRNN